MRGVFSYLFITIFLASHAHAFEGISQDAANFLEINGWTLSAQKTSFATPLSDIFPIHFFNKGARSPSCGLLIQKASEVSFVEILLTEADEQYPHCAGIKDVTPFRWADRLYLLVVYAEKDTRDEIYDRFFYIYQDQNGHYLVDKQLNETSIPVESAKKSSKRVGLHGTWNIATTDDGIRLAKAALIRNAVPSMNFLDRDFISGRTNSFATFQDGRRQKCLFMVESGGSSARFSSDLFSEDGKCTDFLASSKSKKGERTYFLGIFESAAKTRNVAVFSITQDGRIHDERELALLIRNAGKTGDIRTAKAYLQEIAK